MKCYELEDLWKILITAGISQKAGITFVHLHMYRLCCQQDLPFNYVAVSWWRMSERVKLFGRERLRSLTRSMPIGKTGSLNAASPRVTAAICLRPYLSSAGPSRIRRAAARRHLTNDSVYSGCLESSQRLLRRKMSGRNQFPVKRGIGPNLSGVFAGVNNGEMVRDRLQVQRLFFKHQRKTPIALWWLAWPKVAERFKKITSFHGGKQGQSFTVLLFSNS